MTHIKPKKLLLFSFVSGCLAGILFFVQPVARQLAYDPHEYCEDQGVYYAHAGHALEAVAAMNANITGFDYAYVCNINMLHVDALRNLPLVKRYGVTYGNIEEIPQDIGLLSDLWYFQVHDQQITQLPTSIGTLTKLEILKLGGNNITHLPDEIGQLSRLRILHIYDNAILKLPTTIGNLTKLEVIDARDNKLTALPTEIKNLHHTLKKLYLGNNNFSLEEQSRIRTLLPETDIFF